MATTHIPDTLVSSVKIHGAITPEFGEILTPAALEFIVYLQRTFSPRRKVLLHKRTIRQQDFLNGIKPDFLPETAHIRESAWSVASIPADLQQRWTEITGPVERKMIINALNSGADIFMADFEDAHSPTWANTIQGQINLKDAVRRQIDFSTPEGKSYALNPTVATLLVRPRGWHLTEKHVLVDGEQMSGSLFDFGLYVFHNAAELLVRGSAPYFYLPKIESHLEARLWNDVFNAAQDALSIPRGTFKATMLIETITAAFEMEEMLYELRDHAAGLNAGRWDYIFSCIKKFRTQMETPFPDRVQITMTVPFMRSYTDLLVQTCHKRGAHAIGGMAAFIPNRKIPSVTETALEKVLQDKTRESQDGFDGSWVAHPDLVQVAREPFATLFGNTKLHQKDRLREDVNVNAAALLSFTVPGSTITEDGLRNNINVCLQYVEAWLRGNGAVAIHNLMEDAATAEISRTQVWQWIHSPKGILTDGRKVTIELVQNIIEEELSELRKALGITAFTAGKFSQAGEIVERLTTSKDYEEFLTLPAYRGLE